MPFTHNMSYVSYFIEHHHHHRLTTLKIKSFLVYYKNIFLAKGVDSKDILTRFH